MATNQSFVSEVQSDIRRSVALARVRAEIAEAQTLVSAARSGFPRWLANRKVIELMVAEIKLVNPDAGIYRGRS